MIHDPITTRTALLGAGAIFLALAGAYAAYRRWNSTEDAEEAGYTTGHGLGTTIVDPVRYALAATLSFVGGFAMSLTRLLPKSEAIYDAMLKAAYKGMHKTSGGDIVGIIARDNGQLDHKPMLWKRSSPDDPTEPDRWVTKEGERWHPGAEGRGFDMVGSTPVALFDEDAEGKGSFLQSRFQAALDLGYKEALFVPDRVEQVVVEVDPEAVDEGGPEAVADGGAVQSQVTYNIPDSEWPDKLADVLVDLSAPNGEAGMRVSAKAYKEVYQEKVGSEEMQMQELRGRAAEADPQSAKDLMFRVMKWIAIIVLASRAPELLALLMGTGVGDAVSGISPFMVVPYLPV